MKNARALLDVFDAALAAVDPRAATQAALRIGGSRLTVNGREFDLDAFDRVFVVGAGKAAASMATAVEQSFGARVRGGLVIVKHGHGGPRAVVEQVEAAHPIPDRAGL